MAKKAAQGRTQRLTVPVLAAALAAFASRRGSTAPKSSMIQLSMERAHDMLEGLHADFHELHMT